MRRTRTGVFHRCRCSLLLLGSAASGAPLARDGLAPSSSRCSGGLAPHPLCRRPFAVPVVCSLEALRRAQFRCCLLRRRPSAVPVLACWRLCAVPSLAAACCAGGLSPSRFLLAGGLAPCPVSLLLRRRPLAVPVISASFLCSVHASAACAQGDRELRSGAASADGDSGRDSNDNRCSIASARMRKGEVTVSSRREIEAPHWPQAARSRPRTWVGVRLLACKLVARLSLRQSGNCCLCSERRGKSPRRVAGRV